MFSSTPNISAMVLFTRVTRVYSKIHKSLHTWALSLCKLTTPNKMGSFPLNTQWDFTLCAVIIVTVLCGIFEIVSCKLYCSGRKVLDNP